MFTIKIINEGQDNTYLFQWEHIYSHGPFSAQFEAAKLSAIERADDEIKDMCQLYYAHIHDGGGNEFWLSIGDDCFVTDSSGKTVLIHRSPDPEHEDDFKED